MYVVSEKTYSQDIALSFDTKCFYHQAASLDATAHDAYKWLFLPAPRIPENMFISYSNISEYFTNKGKWGIKEFLGFYMILVK